MTPTDTYAGLRAGAVTRLAASVADAIVIAAVWRGTIWWLNISADVLRRFAPPFDLAALVLASLPLISGAYYVGFWWAFGQTPGKWLLGVRVVTVGGGRMTLWRSLLRLIGYLFAALPCYLGFLWILGPERRGWHDQFAGTEVVYLARKRIPEHRKIIGLHGIGLRGARSQPQA